MGKSHREGDLIGAIYDAIIDPSRWDEVVKRIVEGTKSFSGNLLLHQADAGSLAALYNVDPVVAESYAQTYYKDDPLRTPAWSIAPGEVRACSYTQTDRFKASAYYDEFVRPQGWVESSRVLRVPPMCSRFWLLQDRPVRLGWNPRNGTYWKPSRRICSARPRSMPCLPGREQQRTRSPRPSVSPSFSWPGIAESSSPTPRPRTGGTIELCRGENRPPLLAHVIPLGPKRAVAIFDLDRPAVAVFVVDPAAGLGAQIERFAARFGLTLAETRVLAEIIGGNGLLAAATNLNITEKTARTHMTRIFEKTLTTRQTKLFRRFFESALPGAPGAPEFANNITRHQRFL